MSEFTDFYKKQAGVWWQKRHQASMSGDFEAWEHANREFETYCQHAGLSADWQPEEGKNNEND